MNSRNQVHSGVYNLDYFICGGYPVGGVTLIEEDEFACLSNVLLNCTVSNQLHDSRKVLVSLPAKIDTDLFLKDLPVRRKSKQADQTDQSMKIAWRYSNLPDLDEVSSQNKNDSPFELKKKVDAELIKEKGMTENLHICTHDLLLESLSNQATRDSYPLIVIKNYATLTSEFDESQFCTFLFRLKSLSRSAGLCIVLSVNPNYLSPLTRQLATNIVDCCLAVERLTENSVYRDYLGLIKIHKLPKLNCLNYQTTTETLEIGIQLKKDRFLNVDKLFLPPELSDAPSRTACSTTKIDF